MPKKTPAGDILEIIEAIDRIAKYTSGFEEADFNDSNVVYDAVLMNLIVIGEAVRRLDAGVLAQEASVPWFRAVGLRNRIAHGYGEVEPYRIWLTVQDDLGPMRDAAARLLALYEEH